MVAPATAVFVLGLLAWYILAWRRPRHPERIASLLVERGRLSREQLDRPWLIRRIASRHGYDIVTRVLPGPRPRVAIFHHGVRWNWMGALRYAEWFIRQGWTVVAFDARGHGETRGMRRDPPSLLAQVESRIPIPTDLTWLVGAPVAGAIPPLGDLHELEAEALSFPREMRATKPSFGWFERDDLLSVADAVLAEWPHGEGFVVHGESLGAATAIQYAPLDPRLDALIADCPFSSAREILDLRFRSLGVPAFLRRPAVRAAEVLMRRLEGWAIGRASPRRASLETGVPMLFVHGTRDRYVPWSMSVSMVEGRRRSLPDSITELRLVPKARHAESFKVDPAGYEATVAAFLERALAAKARPPSG